MPLYDYQCKQCKAVREIRHGFREATTEVCAACGGELQRVFNPAPIVFKGSGFYKTDSRGSAPSESAPSTETKKSEPAA